MPECEELPDFDRLWNYRDPAESERRFRELVPRASTAGNAAYFLELQTQIARALGLQRKFDEAHALLDSIEALLQGAAGNLGSARPRIRYLLERGRTFNSSGQPGKAIPLFREAWDLGRNHQEDFFAVDAAHMLAIVGEPAGQIEWSEKALDLAERSPDEKTKGWLGALYNNLGWSNYEMGNFAEALRIHERSLEWRKSRGHARETLIAKWSVAKVLRALGRTDDALQLQRELLAEWEELGEEDGFVYEELGECALALGRNNDACAWFAKAHPLLERIDWIRTGEPARLDRLARLARGGE